MAASSSLDPPGERQRSALLGQAKRLAQRLASGTPLAGAALSGAEVAQRPCELEASRRAPERLDRLGQHLDPSRAAASPVLRAAAAREHAADA